MSDENRQGSGNFRANNGGQKRTAGGNRMSGNRTGGKNFGGKKPFSGEKRSFGGSKPAFGGEKRSFGGDKPAYNGEKRSFGGNKPAYNGEKRSFGGDKPAYNGEKRAFGGDKPAYNGEKRAFRGDKHNDGEKRPAKSGFGGEKRPYGDKKPSFGGKTGFHSAEKRPYGGGNGERRPYPAKPAAPKVEGSDGLPARRLALEVIRAVTENDAYASLVLDEKLNKCTLPLVDRRLAARLVYDTLEHLLTLDYALNSLMAKPDTDIKLRNVLRLGACQILLEDRIPESAACNTSVALCKELGMEGLAGVCNGILRNLVRQKDEIKYPDMETEPVKALSIRYSVPEWLVERLLADWGEDAEKLMGFHQPNAAITIRPNLMKMDEAAFEQFLGSKVWEKEKGMLPFSWRIRNMAEIAHDAGFVGGKFSIQSESSMMVCLAAAPKNGMQILDACAAPGGKSFSAACYFYAMTPLLGIPVCVEHVHFESLQGDVEFLHILEKMGCSAQETENGVLLLPPAGQTDTGTQVPAFHGITVDMSSCSDQAITLAAIAPFADSPTCITGIGHIRFQESDRIHAICTELTRMGIHCEETQDSITIYPGMPHPCTVATYDDHRMAMGFALTGLRAEGIVIDDPGCCRKTFENYFEVLDQVIAKIIEM